MEGWATWDRRMKTSTNRRLLNQGYGSNLDKVKHLKRQQSRRPSCWDFMSFFSVWTEVWWLRLGFKFRIRFRIWVRHSVWMVRVRVGGWGTWIALIQSPFRDTEMNMGVCVAFYLGDGTTEVQWVQKIDESWNLWTPHKYHFWEFG